MFNSSTRLQLRLRERENEYVSYKQFPILIGTFNVNNRSAPPNVLLDDWFDRVCFDENSSSKTVPDIIAVGFQEIDTSGGAYLYDDKRKETEWEQVVTETIKSYFSSTSKENNKFELIQKTRLVGILLFVYVRSIHMKRCSFVSRSNVPTGFMGVAGNKGAVGVRFRFYESDLCFVNAHFASGDGQTQRRNEDYQTVESRMGFTDAQSYSLKDYLWGGASTDSNNPATTPSSSQWWKISDHDIVFWFGDLNYRISQPNLQVRQAIQSCSLVSLTENDQLRSEMRLDKVFQNYKEASINFMPTYKFDINSDNYDTSEKFRTPSWTDRILFQSKRSHVQAKETIDVVRYDCSKTIRFSDHRPVSCLFRVAIKYECDTVRLNKIREELIREIDRLENDLIPTIEVRPRPPQIVFNRIRYLDRPCYSLTIKNVGECPCICTITATSAVSILSSLTLTPTPPFSIDIGDEQHVQIGFVAQKHRATISEIFILHVDNGADTFITFDATFDMGPFGVPLEEFPPTYYDQENKKYVYSLTEQQNKSSDSLAMIKADPPGLYLALIDTLEARTDFNLSTIFSSEVQDNLNLIPVRDQIYENKFQFEAIPTPELFMILLHLFQALPEPLISRQIQAKIFEYPTRTDEIMRRTVPVLVEQLKSKERNLFFRFLLLIQNSYRPIEKTIPNGSLNIAINILSRSILHEFYNLDQRCAFLLACLNEEKT